MRWKEKEKARELIEERSCELVYLLPYSRDPNSIEEAFSKIKGLLRKGKIPGLGGLRCSTANTLPQPGWYTLVHTGQTLLGKPLKTLQKGRFGGHNRTA
jgi:hypothetical protein